MPENVLLQQGLPGGALAQGTQGTLQVILTGGGQGGAQGDLRHLPLARRGWTGRLQRGKPKLYLLL